MFHILDVCIGKFSLSVEAACVWLYGGVLWISFEEVEVDEEFEQVLGIPFGNGNGGGSTLLRDM